MKIQFVFMLLAIDGLVSIGTSSIATATPNIDRDTINLSQTISKLIDLHPDAHHLVELAVNRALLANKCVVDLDAKDLNSSEKEIYQRVIPPSEKSKTDLPQPQTQNIQTYKRCRPDDVIAPEVLPVTRRRFMGARG
jgi:hypothetical protein